MTTINTVRYAAITLLFLLGGCSHRVPQATVEVIDTSLSITPRAEKAEPFEPEIASTPK